MDVKGRGEGEGGGGMTESELGVTLTENLTSSGVEGPEGRGDGCGRD